MQKPPPVYRVDLVLHPARDTAYPFFKDAASHPFKPNPVATIPRVNAWWLAEASLAAYWDPPDATDIYSRGGFQVEAVSAGSTEAYVAYHADWLVVAFRGTEADEWEDIVTDVEMALVPWGDGLVHRGFRDAVDDIWPALTATLGRLSEGRCVWFCGHGLGAALATLAAHRYPATRGVCTFGSPRVGDHTFATAVTTAFGTRMLRYVNNHDIVTHVPPPLFGYTHIDLRRLIARNGTISSAAPTLQHFFSDLIGAPEQLLTLIDDLESGSSSFTPSFLLDHMAKAYAIWTWNDYDANR